MKRYFLILLVILCFVGIVGAQETDEPYQQALQRIQEFDNTTYGFLDLSGINLRELPPEIGNLSNLTMLNLSNNNLSSLPQELANLQWLSQLMLDNNHFNEFPAVVSELPSLNYLRGVHNSSKSPFDM